MVSTLAVLRLGLSLSPGALGSGVSVGEGEVWSVLEPRASPSPPLSLEPDADTTCKCQLSHPSSLGLRMTSEAWVHQQQHTHEGSLGAVEEVEIWF